MQSMYGVAELQELPDSFPSNPLTTQSDWQLRSFLNRSDDLRAVFDPYFGQRGQKHSAGTSADHYIHHTLELYSAGVQPTAGIMEMFDVLDGQSVAGEFQQASEDRGYSQKQQFESYSLTPEVPNEKHPQAQPQTRSIRKCRLNKLSVNYCHNSAQLFEDDTLNRRNIPSNETKNIPKNYGKAILSFIERNREHVNSLLADLNIPFDEFFKEFRNSRKNINTIADLRSLWVNNRYSREMRILSNLFLRKHSLRYIFNSRVTNFASHIKYRKKLQEALLKPQAFNNIKDY